MNLAQPQQNIPTSTCPRTRQTQPCPRCSMKSAEENHAAGYRRFGGLLLFIRRRYLAHSVSHSAYTLYVRRRTYVCCCLLIIITFLGVFLFLVRSGSLSFHILWRTLVSAMVVHRADWTPAGHTHPYHIISEIIPSIGLRRDATHDASFGVVSYTPHHIIF